MARTLRGEIRWADLNPVRGREQAGLRPVLILSHDVFNDRSGTVIAVALTSQAPRAGFPLTLESKAPGLAKRSWVKISQIRTLAVERIGPTTDESVRRGTHEGCRRAERDHRALISGPSSHVRSFRTSGSRTANALRGGTGRLASSCPLERAAPVHRYAEPLSTAPRRGRSVVPASPEDSVLCGSSAQSRMGWPSTLPNPTDLHGMRIRIGPVGSGTEHVGANCPRRSQS